MHAVFQNIRYGVRKLVGSPGLTLTVLLTLALGIGATTAIFTVDYAALLADLPYPNPNQIVMVWSKVNGSDNSVSVADYEDWKRQSTAFSDLIGITGGTYNIASKDQPVSVNGTAVTPGYYRMLGNPFYLGRDFLPEEGQVGKDHVAILTHKLWQQQGADPGIIGKQMSVDGAPYTVVGVLALGVADRAPGQLSLPLAFKPEEINRDVHRLMVMGRLKPGVTMEQARADMAAVAAQVTRANPKSNQGWGASVEPLKLQWLPKGRVQTLWLLLGAAGFVLLIACVNVANLLLARSISRQKEMAIRSSLGATARMIFAQLLTESLILAILGGLLGVALGYGLLQALIAIMPPNTIPIEADLRMNLPILGFALATTTLAGLLFGCIPARYASRADPAEALKEGGRSGTGSGRHRFLKGLVISEFALAITLLAGAGLAIHSFWKLLSVDLGVRTDHIFTFFLEVPDSRPKEPEQITAYYRAMLAKIDALPGVLHASVQTGVPLEGAGLGMPFSIAGRTAIDPSRRSSTGFEMVTPDYFQTFGIQLEKGRFLNDQDIASGVKVAVVNEEFANKYLKGSDPLLQRVMVGRMTPGLAKLGAPVAWQIVGVTHNVRNRGFREDDPEMQVSFWQVPWPSAHVAVRTAQDPASMATSIAGAVHSVDPQVALSTPLTMEQVRDEVLANDRFTMILFACFAAVALLLAGVGIYGVMNFAVSQRSHEIALRTALGADRKNVIGLVLKEGLALAGIGLGMGLVGAYAIGRAMQSTLYGVSALDVRAFAAVALVLLATAFLACYLPARRAASIEPMEILRSE